MNADLRVLDPEPKSLRDPRIAAVLAQVEQKWGRGALMQLGNAAEPAEVEVIRTGFPALDTALGIGGLPCGRISEIYGADSSGKEAMIAHLVVQCQREEGIAVYLDPGCQLDLEQMRVLGVDFRSLLVGRPSSSLQALEMAIRLARSGGVRLMIVDLQMAWDGETRRRGDGGNPRRGDGEIGGQGDRETGRRGEPSTQNSALSTYSALSPQSSALDLALRRLVSAVDRNGIAFVFVTEAAGRKTPPYLRTQHSALSRQLSALSTQNPEPRTTQPSVLGPQSSKGGQALRFFASVRLEMERKEWIRRGKETVGCRSLVRVAKNKLAPPLKEAEVELLFYRFPPAAPALRTCQLAREEGSEFRALGSESRVAGAGSRL